MIGYETYLCDIERFMVEKLILVELCCEIGMLCILVLEVMFDQRFQHYWSQSSRIREFGIFPNLQQG